MNAAPPGPLPPLREELELLPGPPGAAGAPSWTLHDPARGRYFRLGWPEVEMLARWHLGTPAAVAAAVARETTLTPAAGEVEALARFLAAHNLLQVRGEAALARLLGQAAAARPSWGWWLLKNYLFVRIPLVRPDRWLDAVVPYLGWLYGRGFAALVALVALLGGWLAARQWDTFLATLPELATVEGLVLVAAALALAKGLHELAHAVTAKRYGCRVPSMGVALLVLWPVLYTDLSDAWRLTARRRRLAIGAAGMAAEVTLGAVALLAWSLLPDGPARTAAFALATGTWVVTLTVNLSPFLRFDGYYLLSDFWDIANLQERAFALARWALREALFGLGEPAPEPWPRAVRGRLIAYALATWLYRLVVFVGIAVLVYQLAFKVLGVVLFVVEIGWFLVRPVWAELREWGRRRRRLRFNGHVAVTLAALGGLAALALVPWRVPVTAAALLRAEPEAGLFVARPGRLAGLAPAGRAVAAGEVVLRQVSPDLAYERERTARTVAVLRGQAALQAGEREQVERQRLAWSELAAALAQQRGYEREAAQLDWAAPFAGTLVDVADGLSVGDWLAAGEAVGRLVDFGQAVVEAYVAEAELGRVRVGARGWFVPEAPERPAVEVDVSAIDATSSRVLGAPELASVHGGAVAVREGPVRPDGGRDLVPETPVYRVRLAPVAGSPAPAQVVRGRVRLEGERVRPITALWHRLLALIIRESGF